MAGLWGQPSARPQRCCGAKCSLNVILLQPQAWLRVPALFPALSPRGTTVVVPLIPSPRAPLAQSLGGEAA